MSDRDLDLDTPDTLNPDEVFREPTKEELERAKSCSRMEALALVNLFETAQKFRIRANNKVSAIERGVDHQVGLDNGRAMSEPEMLRQLRAQFHTTEDNAAQYLRAWAKTQTLGRWCASIIGVDYLLAAGLLARIDLHRCCCAPWRHMKGKDRDKIPPHDCPGLVTAGALWRFAGLIDPKDLQWGKGELRPFSAGLKTLMWKIGEQWQKRSVFPKSEEELVKAVEAEAEKKGEGTLAKKELQRRLNVKMANRQKRLKAVYEDPSYLYVRIYMEAKEKEVARNEAGGNAKLVGEYLADRDRMRHAGEGSYKAWEKGRLPDRGVNLRALRKPMKLFLSHYHTVGRELEGLLPIVKPWCFEFDLGPNGEPKHVHYIPPPNWPMAEAGRGGRKKVGSLVGG